MWCDGRVARERKILTEYGIENPRVTGSIPVQATKILLVNQALSSKS